MEIFSAVQNYSVQVITSHTTVACVCKTIAVEWIICLCLSSCDLGQVVGNSEFFKDTKI